MVSLVYETELQLVLMICFIVLQINIWSNMIGNTLFDKQKIILCRSTQQAFSRGRRPICSIKLTQKPVRRKEANLKITALDPLMMKNRYGLFCIVNSCFHAKISKMCIFLYNSNTHVCIFRKVIMSQICEKWHAGTL